MADNIAPPDGWVQFGTHAKLDDIPPLEFSISASEDGMPLWERVVRDERLPILTGYASRRAAGVRKELQRRADAALAASKITEPEQAAAALRGKARGLREAVELIRALETGRRIGRRRRFTLPEDGA